MRKPRPRGEVHIGVLFLLAAPARGLAGKQNLRLSWVQTPTTSKLHVSLGEWDPCQGRKETSYFSCVLSEFLWWQYNDHCFMSSIFCLSPVVIGREDFPFTFRVVTKCPTVLSSPMPLHGHDCVLFECLSLCCLYCLVLNKIHPKLIGRIGVWIFFGKFLIQGQMLVSAVLMVETHAYLRGCFESLGNCRTESGQSHLLVKWPITLEAFRDKLSTSQSSSHLSKAHSSKWGCIVFLSCVCVPSTSVHTLACYLLLLFRWLYVFMGFHIFQLLHKIGK